MKEQVLVVVRPGDDKKYASDFKKIVSQNSPYLQIPELKSLCSENPIVGHVIEDCLGCEKVLSLERLEGLESVHSNRYGRRTWLVAKHINEQCGLGIGLKGNYVEIFLENHKTEKDEYFLGGSYEQHEKTKWVKPSQDFLQRTFDKLPESSKRRFSGLLK